MTEAALKAALANEKPSEHVYFILTKESNTQPMTLRAW